MCLGGVYNDLKAIDHRILLYTLDLVLVSAILSAIYYIYIAIVVGVRMLLGQPRPDWRGGFRARRPA